jgi:integrase
MFLRFCVHAKWIDENPAANLKAPKMQISPTLPFTAEEEQRILDACALYRTHNKHGKRSPARLRAFILTLRYAGLRIGDVATLERKRLQRNRLALYTHKTGVT